MQHKKHFTTNEKPRTRRGLQLLQLDWDWHPVRDGYEDVVNPVVCHLQKANDLLVMVEHQFCKAADDICSIKQYAYFGHNCPFPPIREKVY